MWGFVSFRPAGGLLSGGAVLGPRLGVTPLSCLPVLVPSGVPGDTNTVSEAYYRTGGVGFLIVSKVVWNPSLGLSRITG